MIIQPPGLRSTNNLSDVASTATALSNLGGLALAGGTVTGSTIFSAATTKFGTGQTNSVSILGSAGNPVVEVQGTGNQSLVLQGIGTGSAIIKSANGNILIASDTGAGTTIANNLTIQGVTTGNAVGIVATGTDTNVGLKLQAKGGNQGGVINFNLSPVSITTGTTTLSSSTLSDLFDFTATITGTSAPGSIRGAANFTLSDTVDKTGSNAPIPTLVVNKNWGTGATGQQSALRIVMLQQGATSDSGSAHAQFNPLEIIGQYNYNVGGTSPTAGLGAAYSFYPFVALLAGATYYQYVSNAEYDEEIVGSTQPLTLGGTVTSGDTISLTFTSTSIVGSPLTVSYTFASGNTLAHAVNGLLASIQNNTALGNAGVSASTPSIGSAVLNIFWQGQFTTTLSVAVSGAQTETATLGTFVQGASVGARDNVSFVALGSGRSYFTDFTSDTCIKIATLNGTTGTSYYNLIAVGSNPSVFPIAPGGRLFVMNPQVTYLSNTIASGPCYAPQLSAGWDLGSANFTQYSGFAYRSPGFEVDGVGSVYVGNGKISAASTGVVIDAPNYIGSGNPTIVSGGGGGSGVTIGNYYVGDILTWNNGQFLVTTVNSSTGAVTALQTLVQPWATTSWSGTISAASIKGGSGSGLTMTVPCNQPKIVSVSPSGDTLTGKGSVGATNDVIGHLMIPFVAGAPTGTPTNAASGIAIRYDTTNHKLWCYDNGTSTWKGVVLS